tara:strand:+ start:569 stop:1918 length:1350 start_codon:yes stop_codon:yes gene_type:complete
MKVLKFDAYTDNLFRIFFTRDSRMDIKTFHPQETETNIWEEKDWEILVMSLFDVDKYFLQDDSEKNIEGMKKLLENTDHDFKIYIDGLGEGSDIGTRWYFLFKFCYLFNLHPNRINLFLTAMNVEKCYTTWINSPEDLQQLRDETSKDFMVDKVKNFIPFNYYDNDYISFVYFGVNKFINRDNTINRMGGSYNRLYETDGLFLKPNRELRKHKILSLVANPMTHRLVVQTHLFQNGYDKEGLVSFNTDLSDFDKNVLHPTMLKNFKLYKYYNEEFLKQLPIRLDWEEFDTTQSFVGRYSPNYDFYNSTYFSVVCETNYEMNLESNGFRDCIHYPIFLTEKTLNALWSYHPFLIVNAKGSLQKLKELGFETFSELFDESYDNEFDPQKRLKMVLSEIDRVMKLDKEELHKIYWSMEDKFIHNRNRILDIVLNKTPEVYQDLQKILNVREI